MPASPAQTGPPEPPAALSSPPAHLGRHKRGSLPGGAGRAQPAASRGPRPAARRGRPCPRAAARCRAAGRCPARLPSHSALCHAPVSFGRESTAQISEPALPRSAGTDISRPGLLTPSRARRRGRWGGQSRVRGGPGHKSGSRALPRARTSPSPPTLHPQGVPSSSLRFPLQSPRSPQS